MKKKAKLRRQEEELLRLEIRKAKLALETAYSNFENVVDPDLIDCYIYEVNAVQKRYKYLLKQAKLLTDEDLAEQII
ncbi:YaaL family protein [Anaerosporobacter faecicola]|uniref:YaaL family protein n=1 Tax=Anaerosporobacter faecicola TaxID=2718714 RepID=UPI00143BD1D5|nr:YaaL family protein [Anaerosporobacter faecicola]